MPGVVKTWGPDSESCRDSMVELEAEYGVLVRVEITASNVPRRGQLYVRAVALVDADGPGLVERCWRGEYFPNATSKTLTALMYGLLVGLERDLGVKRVEVAKLARQEKMPLTGD